ncbi:MAG TPA: lanthionine synthetase LanC family protein, partial [Candidatus Baltobacteraceae bacterium]|nr:lanthionine synthetase LanC family protein [Candidatus Baltobacteraceae bacterium]
RRTTQTRPLRPSWCYGTPGLARAQQLAAIANHNTARQDMAERAFIDCLSDPDQLQLVTDTSLCHGWAGLFQTTWRAAHDACTPAIAAHIPHLSAALVRYSQCITERKTGLLEGFAGLALALHTAARGISPESGWDTCLLIN